MKFNSNQQYLEGLSNYYNDIGYKHQGTSDWTPESAAKAVASTGKSVDEHAGTYLRRPELREHVFNSSQPQQQPKQQGVDFGDMRQGINTAYTGAMDRMEKMGEKRRTNVNQAYDQARAYLPHLQQQRLQPQIQDTLSQLASRGMIDSSIAENALGQAAQGSMGDILNLQAQLAQEEGRALAGAEGDIFSGLAGLTGDQAQMEGQASMGEYEILAQLLPTLLSNAVA